MCRLRQSRPRVGLDESRRRLLPQLQWHPPPPGLPHHQSALAHHGQVAAVDAALHEVPRQCARQLLLGGCVWCPCCALVLTTFLSKPTSTKRRLPSPSPLLRSKSAPFSSPPSTRSARYLRCSVAPPQSPHSLCAVCPRAAGIGSGGPLASSVRVSQSTIVIFDVPHWRRVRRDASSLHRRPFSAAQWRACLAAEQLQHAFVR